MSTDDVLRRLPSVDRLLQTPALQELAAAHDRDLVLTLTRALLDESRAALRAGLEPPAGSLEPEALAAEVAARLQRLLAPSLRRALNATGVILHTGLGRARLPETAVAALHEAAEGYCNLAVDPETGQRGRRDDHVRQLLCDLTGAEDATVVNNNAAATLLLLNTLAQGKEVIVSRGQLVEIGGSFRMPDVMTASGAILREVGTTNKTHLRDYEAAIGEHTGALLHVHQSNYRIVGFTAEPGIGELAELAHRHGLPVIDDLGSGALVDLRRFGLNPEPLVLDSLRAGADVACFSGDKLIGGPQCGILAGRAEVLARVRRNQLLRAFRVGKLTLAALEATLKLFLSPAHLPERHPTYRMFALTVDELQCRAEELLAGLSDLADRADLAVLPGESQIGSGTSPTETLPTRVLSVRPRCCSAEVLARRLRRQEPPVFARVHQEAVLLDPRTLALEELPLAAAALRQALAEEPAHAG